MNMMKKLTKVELGNKNDQNRVLVKMKKLTKKVRRDQNNQNRVLVKKKLNIVKKGSKKIKTEL